MDDLREKAKHKLRLRYGLSYAEPTDEQFNCILREVKDLFDQGLGANQIEVKLGEIVRNHCSSFETAQYAPQAPHVLIEALMGLLGEQGP